MQKKTPTRSEERRCQPAEISWVELGKQGRSGWQWIPFAPSSQAELLRGQGVLSGCEETSHKGRSLHSVFDREDFSGWTGFEGGKKFQNYAVPEIGFVSGGCSLPGPASLPRSCLAKHTSLNFLPRIDSRNLLHLMIFLYRSLSAPMILRPTASSRAPCTLSGSGSRGSPSSSMKCCRSIQRTNWGCLVVALRLLEIS